ncbi:hypothetical protein VEGS15_20950 [Escherichia coli]|nr:hypothetical protein VEGS15_20950 [Escherichia coli]SVF51372.1 Uncharacterised protein [Escherichia coli]
MTTKQMIDPRTPIGRATLRYRGLPTRHLLSLLPLGLDDTERPYYSRDELIAMLVDRDLNNQLRRAFAKLDPASTESLAS